MYIGIAKYIYIKKDSQIVYLSHIQYMEEAIETWRLYLFAYFVDSLWQWGLGLRAGSSTVLGKNEPMLKNSYC
jgi:hypothetical protein